jgi:O-antigen/teichoic acid export membrane protein
MKIGQTSLVVFVSKVVGSALGFLSTLYFARTLGAEVLGVYALVLTVVAWLILVADLGVGQALIKRISEGTEQGAHTTAAVALVLALTTLISAVVLLGRPLLESYIAEFDQYVALSVVWFVVGFILAKLFYRITVQMLKGERKVHIAGLLDPTKIGVQSLIQVVLVVLGFGLFGMLVGGIVGAVLAGAIGQVRVGLRPVRPARRHFRSLFNYAKFSWLGNLKARAFNEVDILLLGVFVQTSLVGVYSVAWSLSKFLDLFGTAIRSTLFPELSRTSTRESRQAAAGMVEDALAYTGLIAIPGLVGGILLGDRLLMLYGEEFTDGSAVLGLLILAVLVFSYQKQLMGGLNGLDRPDLAFRVNVAFILLNAGLNLGLIRLYGIEGAAVATVLSTTTSLGLAYYMLSQLITFRLPYSELSRQVVAALAMGVVVFGARRLLSSNGMVNNNAIIVVSLVGLGAGVYFLTLLVISTEFRATVDRNLPVDMPFLG